MKKSFARPLLWILTSFFPLVIAACYGAYYRFFGSGTVTDAETGEPIKNIEVTCRYDGQADGDQTYTFDDGTFEFGYDEPCDRLRFADVDGAENGEYETKEVPYERDVEAEVQLTPATP